MCWAGAAPPQRGKRAETTLERWQQLHDLLGKGTGLLECARRLDLSLNTVKRYARAEQPERLRRAPQYRPTLVDPYRGHLRKRCAEDPAVPVQRLLREIRNSATRQLEPARPVHHPGPRRGRPAAPVTPPRGLSRRAVPRCDTGPHTGRARLGYGRARVLPKKHTGTASGRGLTCTNSGTPQPPISATRSPPPADHGQDPAQVPAHRHALRQARRRSRSRGHQPARPAKADSLTTEQLCSSPGRPGPLPGCPGCFRCAPRRHASRGGLMLPCWVKAILLTTVRPAGS